MSETTYQHETASYGPSNGAQQSCQNSWMATGLEGNVLSEWCKVSGLEHLIFCCSWSYPEMQGTRSLGHSRVQDFQSILECVNAHFTENIKHPFLKYAEQSKLLIEQKNTHRYSNVQSSLSLLTDIFRDKFPQWMLQLRRLYLLKGKP